MIQRIQSVYLLLAFIAAALMFFFPFAEFGDTRFMAFGLDFADAAESFSFPLALLAGGLAALLAILLVLVIFRYKNRKSQMSLLMIATLINFFLIAAVFLITARIQKLHFVDTGFTYGVATYLPLIALLFIVMANRAIKKDEALVKAADRLR